MDGTAVPPCNLQQVVCDELPSLSPDGRRPDENESALQFEEDSASSAQGGAPSAGRFTSNLTTHLSNGATRTSTQVCVGCSRRRSGIDDAVNQHTPPFARYTSATSACAHSDPRCGCSYQNMQSLKDGQTYMIKVCEALLLFGAPTHRLERYMALTSKALSIHVQTFYMPSCMFICFSGDDPGARDFRIIRSRTLTNFSKLHGIHVIHKEVIHGKLIPASATIRIDEIMKNDDPHALWFRVLAYGLGSACMGPLSYNAQPIDLPIIFCLGTLVGLSELILAPRSELFGYIFEICLAVLVSFLGRTFGSIQIGRTQGFCFSAISQASVVMILPGLMITNSALELISQNIVSGAVRMVYCIVYTLFLSLSFTIGIIIYGAIDSNAATSVDCRSGFEVWWKIIFVIPFVVCYNIVNQGLWRKMPTSAAIGLAGWSVYYFSNQQFSVVPPLAEILGSLTIGILANLYARVRRDLAAGLMQAAIFLLVPGSFAASGSLLSGLEYSKRLFKSQENGTATSANGNTNIVYSQFDAALIMVQLAVAITVGLSVSVLLVYPFRKKTKSGIFSF